MLLRCLLFLVCLISANQSLSQETSKAKSRVPVTKPTVASKKVIIYVTGDVHSPMGVTRRDTGPTTVLKVLAMAGGANPTASLHKAKIIRKDENGPIEVLINLQEILAGKAPDVTLQAGDILFVPCSSSKSATRKPPNEIFYDVPPYDPLQGPTPIYNR
jgi:protein involved in polysaccharide export with SLBB domain